MQNIQTPPRALAPRDDNRPSAFAEKKKRVKASQLCKTPPTLIRNSKGQGYHRGPCVGEGGFARCFQVNSGSGELFAAKTIAKASLTKEKTRIKLIAEIKIHKSLSHPNIVRFESCFEDDINVYILLEMCSNQSLMEMVRHRRRLTELEARYFLVQILGAIHYMHGRLVIHRDLKLGNIFVDSNMNLKIGDFGLAARLDNLDQRRHTMCGTPNYLAPEVLRKPHDHSFPIDIWAAGVILYAMLFGKPPFQEKNVDTIYRRIRAHNIVFPEDSNVSLEARDLILLMMHENPEMRPTARQVLEHKWFDREFVASIPVSALRTEPVFSVSLADSRANFMAAKIACGLSLENINAPVEAVSPQDLHKDKNHVLPKSLSPPSTKDHYHMVVVAKANTADSPLLARQRNGLSPSKDTVPSQHSRAQQTNTANNNWPLATRTSTTATQQSTNTTESLMPNGWVNSNGRPSTVAAAYAMRSPTLVDTPAVSGQTGMLQLQFDENMQPTTPVHLSLHHAVSYRDVRQVTRQSIERTRHALVTAIQGNLHLTQPTPKNMAIYDRVDSQPIYVTMWADFDKTWGLSYGTSDAGIGMKFRDGTSMRFDPNTRSFMYYEFNDQSGKYKCIKTSEKTHDRDRAKKVALVKFAHDYMAKRLGKASKGMAVRDASDGPLVVQFVRGLEGSYVMFLLSDGSLQFNFADHNKIILHENGSYAHILTAERQEYSWTLTQAFMLSNDWRYERLDLRNKFEQIARALSGY